MITIHIQIESNTFISNSGKHVGFFLWTNLMSIIVVVVIASPFHLDTTTIDLI